MDSGEMQAIFVFDAQDVVGESLIWDQDRKALVWVDIIGRRIHQLDPALSTTRSGKHRTS